MEPFTTAADFEQTPKPAGETPDAYVTVRLDLPIPRDRYDAMSEKERAQFLRLAEWAASQILDPVADLPSWRLEHLWRRDLQERLSEVLAAFDDLRRAFFSIPAKRRSPELKRTLRNAYERVAQERKRK